MSSLGAWGPQHPWGPRQLRAQTEPTPQEMLERPGEALSLCHPYALGVPGQPRFQVVPYREGTPQALPAKPWGREVGTWVDI